MGDVAPAGMFPLRGPDGARPPYRRSRIARCDRRDALGRRADQHPVHQRHDRQPEGRDAHAPQRRQQRALDRDGDAFHRAGHAVHPGAAVSLLGMVLAVLACVSKGATMVFPGEAFDPVATLAAVADERCTALHGVPTMFIAGFDHPEFAKFDLSTLRTGIMAGSPCPIETMKRVVSQMHLSEITIAYGMTETAPCRSRADRRSAREAHDDGGAHPAAPGSEDRRSERRHRAGRHDGRAARRAIR